MLAQLHDDMDLERDETFDPEAPLTNPLDVTRPERAQALVVESTGGISFDPEIPSFGPRVVGLLVDTAVLLVCLLPGALVAALGGSGVATVIGLLVGVVGFVAAATFYARGLVASGQWIGNRVANTRVVDVRNGSYLDIGHAFVRFVVRFVISPIFLIGFLIALGNSQRRTFQDQVAGSVVTRPPRQTWSVSDDESPT